MLLRAVESDWWRGAEPPAVQLAGTIHDNNLVPFLTHAAQPDRRAAMAGAEVRAVWLSLEPLGSEHPPVKPLPVRALPLEHEVRRDRDLQVAALLRYSRWVRLM